MIKSKIRDAATIILIRDRATAPKILMGQRGAKAAFMPNKFVFPGGAVDEQDFHVKLATPLPAPCRDRLTQESSIRPYDAIVAAAIRELWEETGLIMGVPGKWPDSPPSEWKSFARMGYLPSGGGLRFVFRAITPPGRPRRFDARFFMAEASQICGDPDDFTHACDELSHLQWIPLEEVRHFDLPFITEVVVAEVAALIRSGKDFPATTPFFSNSDEESLFLRLKGKSPLTTSESATESTKQ